MYEPLRNQIQRLCAELAEWDTGPTDTNPTSGSPNGGDPTGDDQCGRQDMLDLIEELETLKSGICATQARLTVRYRDAQIAADHAAGIPAAKCGAGVAGRIALARHESPHRGSRYLGLATALVHELPRTLETLAAGHLNEWRATIIARETAHLSPADRRRVDAELAPSTHTLSDRQLTATAFSAAYRADPTVILRRGRHAESERYVSLRPAPDSMTILSAYLPVAQGVAIYQTLTNAAQTARATGDSRTKGQLMADTLYNRITGRDPGEGVDIELGIIMSPATLCGANSDTAQLTGYGPISADLARRLIQPSSRGTSNNSSDDDSDGCGESGRRVEDRARVWVRRLFTDPHTGAITGQDRRRRLFPAAIRSLIIKRDQYCRTPWCGAPIQHIDHIIEHSHGGATTSANAQGLCERCNYHKQAPAWHNITTSPAPGGQVRLTLSDDRTLTTAAPKPPGT